MILFLLLLLHFSSSHSPYITTFVGNYNNHLKIASDDEASLKIDYIFYSIANDHGETLLVPLNTTNDTDKSHFLHDDFLFVFGNLQFQGKEILISGIYNKNLSEIHMFHVLELFFSKELIKILNNFINPPMIRNETEIFSFIEKVEFLSENFNFSEFESNITQSEIQKIKENQTYVNESDAFFKKFIVSEKLQLYSIEIFQNRTVSNGIDFFNFPNVYLKLKESNIKERKMKYEMSNFVDGFINYYYQENEFIITKFIEIKANQIDVFLFIKNSRKFGLIIAIYFLITYFFTNKIYCEFIDVSCFRYFYFISYDLAFVIFLNRIHSYVKIINDGMTTSSFYILSIIFMLFSYFNINSILDDFPRQINFENIKKWVVKISLFLGTVVMIKKKDTKLSDFSIFIFFFMPTILIPQILFNSLNAMRNFKLSFYMILVSYFRFFEISFYFLHIRNNCKKMIVLLFIFITIESIILIIQCFDRSAFSLRMKIKLKGFDYYGKKCPDNSDCAICYSEINSNSYNYMITPCNHAFHDDCLQKWMKHKMICPICRSKLSPVKPFPPFL